jgi:fatty acid desaturase
MRERRDCGERGVEHVSSLERQDSKARRGIGEDERIASFGRAIDALRREVEAELGDHDLAHVRRIASMSRWLEVLGRGLLHVSFEPVTFGLGVCALWLHKQLEASEIGHTVLHGAYDRIPGADEFHAEGFRWKLPIDEAHWQTVHNIRHHQYTNIAERDPDMQFVIVRLSARVPYRRIHRLQPYSVPATWLGFAAGINLHVTGLLELYVHPNQKPDLLSDRSLASICAAHRAALGKFVRYYGRELVLFPMLAGPFFWKVLLGNLISELIRDSFLAAAIYCGHVAAMDYPRGAHARGRAHWYQMQVESAHDFEAPGLLSILCGGLDRQIEHHLFPRFPPNRLRDIAPRVRTICEEHGVHYRTDTWRRTLVRTFQALRRLASPAAPAASAEMHP